VRNVSHELRTPLASIKGFAATILHDPDMPAETAREFVGIINDESDKLVVIVNDILDLSKMMAGHMRYVRERLPLEPLVGEVVRLLSVLAQEKGLALDLEVADPACVHGDRNRMAQVFKNLIGNAIKFTDGGGIRVRQWVADGEVHVAVADTGSGIPAADLPHIFENFYRVEGGDRLREGTGLGLALVRMILDAHVARLEVESEEGRGSVFTVHLPLAGEGTCPSGS
jgi:two-component system phosphate regulon sensor histidine kinase PhoR